MTELTIVGYNDDDNLATFTFEYNSDFANDIVDVVCTFLNINGGTINLPDVNVHVVTELGERYTQFAPSVTIKAERVCNCGWYIKSERYSDTPMGEGDVGYELLRFAGIIK